jgi:hypothetical protein
MQQIRHGLALSLLIAAILIGFPARAHADAGIPMMPVRYPVVLLYLLPVIAIETAYLHSQLDSRLRRTLVAVTGSNMVTMALGYPLAYFIYTALNSVLHIPESMSEVFRHAGWLPMWLCVKLIPEWTDAGQSIWPVLGMFIVLLVPGYYLSGAVKVWLVEWYDPMKHRLSSTKAEVWMANRLSYMFLWAAGCVILYRTYNPT